ncbi:MAG: 3-dehydroquinate synthase [Cyclobacteriaceae bacterium]|nr:3-dehydroquinate synthase [Cyclobacteriaceae bacterium]
MADFPPGVVITDQIATAVAKYLSAHQFSMLGVLVDDNTFKYCYPLIQESLPQHFIIEIASGETHKNLQTCQQIWNEMTHQHMDRGSILINLGGGVIGDMGGFCAAIFKRGIRFVNIPTTLLAQVDASVGGKLGIDFQDYKNHLGVFQHPERVLISTLFLNTLPFNELRSGFAEVLKHALISDAEYWHKIIQADWQSQDWAQHVEHSVEIKSGVVKQDPQESGLRKILNFGHTVGHAIEKEYLSTANPFLHGEAIAIGMICEAYLSHRKTTLGKEHLMAITQQILKWFGNTSLDPSLVSPIAQNTLQDKKNTNGKIKCSLLEGIGQATFDIEVTLEEVKEALEYYQEQAV